MTVNTTSVRSGPYTGNDIADTFSYTFKIEDKTQLIVYETTDTGVESILTVDNDYIVNSVGDDSGGTITRVAGALPTGYEWFIRSNYEETQLTAFQSQGAFFPDLHENAIDKVTFLIQQIIDDLSKSPRLSNTYSGPLPITLDNPSPGAILKWNGAGDGLVNTTIGELDSSVIDASTLLTAVTLGEAIADTDNYEGKRQIISDRGYAVFQSKTGQTANTANIVACTGVPTLSLVLDVHDFVNLVEFGGVGDDSTYNATVINAWLDVVITSGKPAVVPDGIFLCESEISKSFPDGITLLGRGVLKAAGANRKIHIAFLGAQDDVLIDGVTFDGNNITARTLSIENASSTIADVILTSRTSIINTRNNAPDTFTASGLWVRGGFRRVFIDCKIDSVESTSTTGASAAGIDVTYFNNTGQYPRITILGSQLVISNVRNSNTVLADADGIRVGTLTSDLDSIFVVCPGATFIDCEGRSIKSQVANNSINAPVITRSLYDGLVEIDLQYAGGHVTGAKLIYTDTRVNTVIGVTQRPVPDNTQCVIKDNELTVLGTPSSNTGIMISTNVSDSAVKCQGIVIKDNLVKGTVDYMTNHRVANVLDVNRVIISGNWAETIAIAYLRTTLYGSSRAQLTVVFTDNGCLNQCTGSSITDDLIVEYSRNNHNISPLLSLPFNLTISAGEITAYGATHRVNTEGGASSDDLDTINGPNRSVDDWLTLYANSSSRTVVLKDGTGNLRLSGDFSLTNTEDRITLSFDGTNWVEISRSDNGA